MEHQEAMAFAGLLLKESKGLNGMAQFMGALPLEARERRIKFACILHKLADGLIEDGPASQDDLFDGEPANVEPVPTSATVQCEHCQFEQTDLGPDTACAGCGRGPMPTKLTGLECLIVADVRIPLSTTENWSLDEQSSVREWKRGIQDGVETVARPQCLADALATELALEANDFIPDAEESDEGATVQATETPRRTRKAKAAA